MTHLIYARRRVLTLAAVALGLAGAASADTQRPIRLSTDDLYYTYTPARGFTPTGTNIKYQPPANAVGLCGFAIHGNHSSRTNPKVEWDFNLAELVTADKHIAGVSAGTFDVDGKTRKPRSPIVDLTFQVDGDQQPIPVEIIGSPNADNAIKGMLETEPARKLFDALSDIKIVTISLKYANQTSDVLEIRGAHDWRSVGSGKNSHFNQCMRGETEQPLGTEHVK